MRLEMLIEKLTKDRRAIETNAYNVASTQLLFTSVAPRRLTVDNTWPDFLVYGTVNTQL